MWEIDNVFAELQCDDGRRVLLGDGQVIEGYDRGPHLVFTFLVKGVWYEAVGSAKIPISDLYRDCEQFQRLTTRQQDELRFEAMYGLFRMAFKTDSWGNFVVNCEFGKSEYDSGEIQDTFVTHVWAIDAFREGIEAVLRGIAREL